MATYEEHLARIRATNNRTAKDRWDEAVETAFIQTNNRGKAVALANRKNPGLREAMLKQVNESRPAAPAAPTARQRPDPAIRHQRRNLYAPTGNALTRWNNAVAHAVGECRGGRKRAVAMANNQNPGLREEMLAEVNQ